MNLSLRRLKPLLTLLFLLLVMTGSTLMVAPVSAASILVNSAADTMTNDGKCTLREAIHNSHFDTRIYSGTGECAAGTYGPDTISFMDNYTITLDSGSGQLSIGSEISIIGRGAENTIIQASVCNPITQDCSHNYRVFAVSGRLTLDSVTVRHGQETGDVEEQKSGGGIYNYQGTVYITNSVVTANRADDFGGGILNLGSLIITNSLLQENKAVYGGGIFNHLTHVSITNSSLINNQAVFAGGGLFNSEGTLVVAGSTFAGNSAEHSGGAIVNQGTVTIANSTLSGNSAGQIGGAIYNEVYSGRTMNIKNSTISGNSAGENGGGIFLANDSTENSVLNYWNTIIAYSTAGGDCYQSNPANIGTNVNNLVEDGSCDGTPGDPKLGPLADNGGPTLTHALLPGSPAINTGHPATCAADPVNNLDQRGVTRPKGAVCDIGALEQYSLLFLPLILR